MIPKTSWDFCPFCRRRVAGKLVGSGLKMMIEPHVNKVGRLCRGSGHKLDAQDQPVKERIDMKNILRTPLARFADRMEERLIEKDRFYGGDSWHSAGIWKLYLHLARAVGKLAELVMSLMIGAVTPKLRGRIDDKAADVANFAMMIADKARSNEPCNPIPITQRAVFPEDDEPDKSPRTILWGALGLARKMRDDEDFWESDQPGSDYPAATLDLIDRVMATEPYVLRAKALIAEAKDCGAEGREKEFAELLGKMIFGEKGQN